MMSYAQSITKSFRMMKTKIIPLLFNPECAACNKKRLFLKILLHHTKYEFKK